MAVANRWWCKKRQKIEWIKRMHEQCIPGSLSSPWARGYLLAGLSNTRQFMCSISVCTPMLILPGYWCKWSTSSLASLKGFAASFPGLSLPRDKARWPASWPLKHKAQSASCSSMFLYGHYVFFTWPTALSMQNLLQSTFLCPLD